MKQMETNENDCGFNLGRLDAYNVYNSMGECEQK